MALRTIWMLALAVVFQVWSSAQTRILNVPMENFSVPHGLSSKNLGYDQPLCVDREGNLWICTRDGLNKFNGTHFEVYQESPSDTNTILGSDINCVYADHQGRIWVGSWLSGLSMIHPLTGKVRRYANIFGAEESHSIKCIFEDSQGRLWVGAHPEGLGLYFPEADTFRRFALFADEAELAQHRHSQNSLRNFTLDRAEEDIVWFAAARGLHRFNTRTFEHAYFLYDGNDSREEIRLANAYRHIHQDSDNILWMTTWGADLMRFDPAEEKFTRYRNPPQHPSYPSLMSLNEDTLLLTAGGVGFVLFDKSQEAFSLAPSPKSPSIHPYYPHTLYIDRDSNVWLTTSDEGIMLSRVHDLPGESEIATQLRPVVTSVSSLGQQFTPYDMDQGINLQPRQNYFSIEYSVMDRLFCGQKEFRYALDGLDEGWIFAGRRNLASYSNLRGGKYTFRLQARREDGEWSSAIAQVPIHLTPTLLQRWWFWPSAILVILCAVLFVYRKRIRAVRQKEAVKTQFEKQIAELEMQALRAQMNPHFLFNSLNSIKYYVVERDPVKAAEYIDRFSMLMRQVLQNSRQKLIPLSSEIEALDLYIQVEQLRFEKRFEYEINIQEGLDLYYYQIPPLLLQPYVENAIWHGLMHKKEEGRLSINVSHTDETVLIVIEDDGVGRMKSAEINSQSGLRKHSLGMKMTADRIAITEKLHDIKIAIKIEDLVTADAQPAGTRVIIAITSNSK